MDYAGLIGYPLSHSISPVFQQAALDFYGLGVRYVLWETKPGELESRVDDIRRDGYIGANVTVPHKESVIKFLDNLSGEAADIGAVNVIVKTGKKLEGHNTDVQGFLLALTQDGGFVPEGKTAVVLGAGGAARAVVYGLMKSGIGSLAVINRNADRAETLVGDLAGFRKPGQSIIACGTGEEQAARFLGGCSLLVNCTPTGMKGSASEKELPVTKEMLPRNALVYDLVYNPVETPLLKLAKKSGEKTIGGLPMLIYQGAASFELWTGKKAPVDVMFEAAKKALR
ncbi:MAG: shikimate dehydrogenase [Dehalococcoidia bacterium]|nr:shikimate dehydrogenase [Dehalococcoidia bacterium]